MNIKSWFCILFLSLPIKLLGQFYISGKVADHRQELPSATVLLLNADSTLVKGILTEKKGEFKFDNVANGQYLIVASMIGYTRYCSGEIIIAGQDATLSDIILEEESTELGEIVVKATKPLFEQQIDRLVVNVQSSITSSGNTVLEILQKSPGVIVNRQNNSISINGKSGVRLMINDKVIQLPLDAAMQLLNGMNSSNVEKIELITAPSARYDAEGTAGVIHIVTKKNSDIGTNGVYSLTAGKKWAETLGGNFSVNHREKKFAFFLDYSVVRDHNQHIMKMDRQSVDNGFVQTIMDRSPRENITTQQNLNAGFEYQVSEHTTVSLLVTGYRRNWDMNAVTDDNNRIASDSTVATHMNIHESNIWQSVTGAMGVQTKLNAKSGISYNVDYLLYDNSNPSQYDNVIQHVELNKVENQTIDLQKKTPVRILVGKADYRCSPSATLTVEAGFKGVSTHLENNVIVQRLTNNTWTPDLDFTSYSFLNETVGGAYVSTKWKAGPNWQVDGGLRYEYSHTTISTPTQANIINRKYGYFFPRLSIQKNIGAEKRIQFSYSRRITRPTYNDIAPYVFFWGPNTFSAGNTSLYPALTDGVSIGYHQRQWIVSTQFTHTKNEIMPLQPEVDRQTNSTIYRSQNLKYLNTVALTNSYSLTLSRWWEVQATVTAQYQAACMLPEQGNGLFQLYGVNANMVNVLNLSHGFSAELSGMYQSKSLAGNSEALSLGSVNAGVQKKLGEDGSLKLSMDDIFNTNYWRRKTYIPEGDFHSNLTYNFHMRYLRITFTKTFGSKKLRGLNLQSGSEEERRRISN